jgi:hypothetical protein
MKHGEESVTPEEVATLIDMNSLLFFSAKLSLAQGDGMIELSTEEDEMISRFQRDALLIHVIIRRYLGNEYVTDYLDNLEMMTDDNEQED